MPSGLRHGPALAEPQHQALHEAHLVPMCCPRGTCHSAPYCPGARHAVRGHTGPQPRTLPRSLQVPPLPAQVSLPCHRPPAAAPCPGALISCRLGATHSPYVSSFLLTRRAPPGHSMAADQGHEVTKALVFPFPRWKCVCAQACPQLIQAHVHPDTHMHSHTHALTCARAP